MEAVQAWADREFSGVTLKDKRRTDRLVRVATAIATRPAGALAGSFSDPSELRAAYRLFASPHASFETIAGPHWARTETRCRAPGDYLLIEDTTVLDFSSHKAATGLGHIGDSRGQGFLLHTTLALGIHGWNAEQEPSIAVEGLFAQKCWTRQEPPRKKTERWADRRRRPRESARWADALLDKVPPPHHARWTLVADREADVYEALLNCQRKQVNFIIRACQPRMLLDGKQLSFDAFHAAPVLGVFELKLRGRERQAARTAQLEVRTVTVTLKPPYRPDEALPPIEIHMIEAREKGSSGNSGLHWILLTTWPLTTLEECIRVIKAYSKRWMIEEYHKALKSGAGVEQIQLEATPRITALLGVLSIVAVRLLSLKFLADDEPDSPLPETAVPPEFLKILKARLKRTPTAWTYRTLVASIAQLGGFLPQNKRPGWQTIWRGWRELQLLAAGYWIALGE